LDIAAELPAATPGAGDRLRGLLPLLLGGLVVSAAAGAAVHRKGRVLAYLVSASEPGPPVAQVHPGTPATGPGRRRLWLLPHRRDDRPGGPPP
ncbi:MAG: hypothetical protein H0U10_14790, partial [Chloroflexia bacterium]|nr:hypothetical protein [Chloroflexia bacterium]